MHYFKKLLPSILVALLSFFWNSTFAQSAQDSSASDVNLCKPSNILSLNDAEKFELNCYGSMNSFSLSIYNRWGTEVYSTTNTQSPTDFNAFARDKKNAYIIAAGTYFWAIKYINPLIEPTRFTSQTGTVSIVH